MKLKHEFIDSIFGVRVNTSPKFRAWSTPPGTHQYVVVRSTQDPTDLMIGIYYGPKHWPTKLPGTFPMGVVHFGGQPFDVAEYADQTEWWPLPPKTTWVPGQAPDPIQNRNTLLIFLSWLRSNYALLQPIQKQSNEIIDAYYKTMETFND